MPAVQSKACNPTVPGSVRERVADTERAIRRSRTPGPKNPPSTARGSRDVSPGRATAIDAPVSVCVKEGFSIDPETELEEHYGAFKSWEAFHDANNRRSVRPPPGVKYAAPEQVNPLSFLENKNYRFEKEETELALNIELISRRPRKLVDLSDEREEDRFTLEEFYETDCEKERRSMSSTTSSWTRGLPSCRCS